MKYDLILYGATGFTGQFAAEYLARNYPPNGNQLGLTWALAGRNQQRLEAIKNIIIQINSACQAVGIIIADTKYQDEVDKMVAQGRVILTTAGPYAQFGTPIVDACVRLGAHYCDITGESLWIKSLIDKYQAEAEKNTVFIVNCCGFDSIPSDIGALMMVDYIRKNLDGRECQSVQYFLKRMGKIPGMGGGTVRTMGEMLQAPPSELIKLLDPYLLNPPNSTKPKTKSDYTILSYDKDAKLWYTTFLMAVINARIVRRSSALNKYHPKFVYNEYFAQGGIIGCLLMSFGLLLGSIFMSIKFFRNMILARLPASGEGSNNREPFKTAYFKGVYVAKTIPRDNEKPITVLGEIISEGDAGYFETAKMLCETAIGLATQLNEVTGHGVKGGIHTPASSLGLILLERLRSAKMTLRVTEVCKD